MFYKTNDKITVEGLVQKARIIAADLEAGSNDELTENHAFDLLRGLVEIKRQSQQDDLHLPVGATVRVRTDNGGDVTGYLAR